MFHLFQPNKNLRGQIRLERSKSLSNRALIIRELCGAEFPIENLSGSADTRILDHLLRQFRFQKMHGGGAITLDAGAGGTTFRFLTAFLAFQPGVQLLTGDERMKERPVGPLVEALRRLGARITYTGNPGFPPLLIEEPDWHAYQPDVRLSAAVSSQFVSALLMVAPTLPSGLHLQLEDTVVSRPYIDMTLGLMRRFGATARFTGTDIRVQAGVYRPLPFTVEADWSAASYFYAFAALSETCDLLLEGLQEQSLQGDSRLAGFMEVFGIKTAFERDGVRLSKFPCPRLSFIEWDFLSTPDLAQTISVLCAALGVRGLFSGLETLRIKETDRLEALRAELKKVNVRLDPLPLKKDRRSGKNFFTQEGKAHWSVLPQFATYGDLRMAMALSILGYLGRVGIGNPGVVDKSYPGFWKDLETLGFLSGHAS